MEIRQLQYFISAAAHLNFTRAARECHIVQTAMTHQIASLEKELGVTLFSRNAGRVSLTPIGEAFLREAQRIVAQTENALDVVNTLNAGQKYSLTLGYCGGTLRPEWPDLLSRFRVERPDVRVLLRQGDIGMMADLLESGAVDAVISIHYDYLGLYSWMEERVLFTDSAVLIVNRDHPFAEKTQTTMSEISGIPMVVYSERGSEEKFAHCANHGHPLDVVAQLSETDCAQILIESGYYSSMCMSHMFDRNNPRIKCVPIIDDMPSSVVALLDKRRVSEHLEAFLALAAKYDYSRREWPDEPQFK